MSPSQEKDTSLQVQDTYRTASKQAQKRNSPQHTIVKTLKPEYTASCYSYTVPEGAILLREERHQRYH